MSVRLTLSRKILLLGLLNATLIALSLFAAFAFQFREDFGSLFLAPARDRVVSVARQIALDLEETDPSQRNALLARRSGETGIQLYLFLNDGTEIAGPAVTLPEAVAGELRRAPPPPPRREPPPPRRAEHEGPPPERGEPPPPPPLRRSQPDKHSGEPPNRPDSGGLAGFFFVRSDGPVRYWMGTRIPIRSSAELPASTPEQGTVLAGFSSILGTPLSAQLPIWIAIAGGVVGISLLCWLPLIRGLTRSIDRMKDATQQIADGRFDIDMKIKRNDEIGTLADAIRRMASRLEIFVKGQKRFLGDTAHELRSPIGRMGLAAEMLERDVPADGAKYVTAMQQDIALMSDMTDQLLTLARSELRPSAPDLKSVRLSDMIDRILQVESGDRTRFAIDVEKDIEVLADPDFLFRSLSNLVRNSLKYAPGMEPIEITARHERAAVIITVADHGPGVPEDALEKIFEPFYRIDTSRDRKTGGTGLGLAIVRNCIEACRGSVECRNRSPHGLIVTLKLSCRRGL